nr:hypothetical protein CFP56_45021 [Quercus suber]
MVDGVTGDVFLLLPRVPLERGASKGCLGMGGLDLATAKSPGEASSERRRMSSLKDYVVDGKKASLVRNYI